MPLFVGWDAPNAPPAGAPLFVSWAQPSWAADPPSSHNGAAEASQQPFNLLKLSQDLPPVRLPAIMMPRVETRARVASKAKASHLELTAGIWASRDFWEHSKGCARVSEVTVVPRVYSQDTYSQDTTSRFDLTTRRR